MTDAPDPVDAFSLFSARADDTRQIRLLRVAVIGMGAVLGLGFAAVVGRIAYLMTLTQPLPKSALAGVSAPGPAVDPVPVEITALLPAGAKARQHTVSGSTVSVLYEAPGGEGIVVFDLRTGRQVSHIRLQTPTK